MYFSITGELTHKLDDFVVLSAYGVGYKLTVSLTTRGALPKLSETVTLYTYHYVRDDAALLYGFLTLEELAMFKMLISVTGVGPKAALSVLSEMTPEKFALAIASGDTKAIQRAQGIGVKTAKRLVLELADKMKTEHVTAGIVSSGAGVSQDAGAVSEAMSALLVLGYSQSEAAMALSGLSEELGTEQMIKEGLKKLSGI